MIARKRKRPLAGIRRRAQSSSRPLHCSNRQRRPNVIRPVADRNSRSTNRQQPLSRRSGRARTRANRILEVWWPLLRRPLR